MRGSGASFRAATNYNELTLLPAGRTHVFRIQREFDGFVFKSIKARVCCNPFQSPSPKLCSRINAWFGQVHVGISKYGLVLVEMMRPAREKLGHSESCTHSSGVSGFGDGGVTGFFFTRLRITFFRLGGSTSWCWMSLSEFSTGWMGTSSSSLFGL